MFADMARRHKSKDISKRMTSRDFSDYPNSELMEEPGNFAHPTGGRKPFSPIAEVEEEGADGESGQSITSRRHTAVSPRTSMSPSHSSVSPVSHSSGSGHSSPRSPPTNHAHPPPPPSQHSARSHQSAPSSNSSGKSRSSHVPKSGSSSHSSRLYSTHGTGPGMGHSNRGPAHHSGGHVTSPPRLVHQDHRITGHTKPYEVHHPPYTLPSQHSIPPYQWVQRVSGVGKSHSSHTSDMGHSTYGQPQDGTNYPHTNMAPPPSDNQQQYETTGGHLSSSVVMVNSRIVPSKMYPTPVVTESSTETTGHNSVEHNINEVINDPGERGSPSGESNPSSTPNSTLGKSTHRSILDPLQASASDSKLTQGEMALERLDPPNSLEIKDDLRSSSSDTKLVRTSTRNTVNESTTKVEMGDISLSVQNARHIHSRVMSSGDHMASHDQAIKAPTIHKSVKSSRSSEASKKESIRVLQPPKTSSSIAHRVAQFNQNGNHSGGATQNDKQEATKTKETMGTPKSDTNSLGVASNSNPTHSPDTSGEIASVKKGAELSRGDSPSSSMEELSNINEAEEGGADETDSAHKELPHPPLIKPDPTKSKPHHITGPGVHQQHPHPSHYPPPPHPHTAHHHSGHTDPPPYAHSLPQQYSSLSQPLPQGMPQGIAQGIVNSPSLSQGPNYVYDPHHSTTVSNSRPDVVYSHSTVYNHPSMAYDGGANRHHHVSPPQHASQSYESHPPPPKYVVPPLPQQHQSLGYRTSHDLQRSHDPYVGPLDHHGASHPGSHDLHMTGHHRGPPPGMQFLQQRSKLPRPEHTVHFTKANIGHAHEAAGTGDLGTLHRMLTNHEIDAFGLNEHNFTLSHKAAIHGRLQVITFLVKEGGLPLTALQIPDDSFTTPAMLAIQGGSVECLQWLVEEGKVPFQVRDTGGETLMHHAAFHGQVNCLEWLLKTVKKRNEQNEIKEILDESGVTPAHFAAQGGHLDCLQLLIDYGYSVVHADRENQKPLDWADAMGQNICVRYLMMYETCWALSAELTHLAEQMALVQKHNEQLRDAFTLQEKEYDVTISKLRQTHEDRLTKMREQHVDLMASILNMKDHDSSPTPGGVASGSSNNKKSQPPVRKAPTEPPSSSQRRSTRPPIPPDTSKKRSGRGSGASYETTKERSHDSTELSRDKNDEHDVIDYRTATPQEVLESKMTSVAQRMNASREARKRQGGMVPRTFSPLTPIIQRMYSKQDEDSKGERSSRSQRHSEPHIERRSAPKVKFSKTVTEFPDYRYPDHAPDDTRPTKSSIHTSLPTKSSGHTSSHGNGTSPGQSPSHSSSGHGHHGNRTVLEGESVRVKGEPSEHGSRKSSSEK